MVNDIPAGDWNVSNLFNTVMSVKILTFFNLTVLCFFIEKKTIEEKNYRSVERPASCRQEPCVSARQFQQQDSNVREHCQPPKGTFARKINKCNSRGKFLFGEF
jgi:hypothetical protein